MCSTPELHLQPLQGVFIGSSLFLHPTPSFLLPDSNLLPGSGYFGNLASVLFPVILASKQLSIWTPFLLYACVYTWYL